MEGEQGFVTVSLGIIKGNNTAGKTFVKQQWARHKSQQQQDTGS